MCEIPWSILLGTEGEYDAVAISDWKTSSHASTWLCRLPLDIVYDVNTISSMATVVQSCRIDKAHAALIARQARRRHVEPSTLSSLYLKEKAIEEEFPGIGFRDAIGGREAFVLGHRVAVWEVVEVHRQARSAAKTAAYFRWPPALVRCALAYAEAYPAAIEAQREAEIAAQ